MRLVFAALLLLGGIAPALAAEKALNIPSDPNARFAVLEVGGDWPNRTIVTRRTGPSGTSYSKRLYDCAAMTVKYLGSGDTLAQMDASPPDPRMGPIVAGSIADYVGREACRR